LAVIENLLGDAESDHSSMEPAELVLPEGDVTHAGEQLVTDARAA
jgi:hypothetical protein